jgi:hypothetical protein
MDVMLQALSHTILNQVDELLELLVQHLDVEITHGNLKRVVHFLSFDGQFHQIECIMMLERLHI